MFINFDPDEWKSSSVLTRCSFHQRYPDRPHPGCTCSCAISQVRRTPEEIAEIKAKRRREHEDAILAEADLIRSRRGKATPNV